MGTLNMTILLCLLFLMPLHLVPGSEAKPCKELSGTYTASRCDQAGCVVACLKERFTQGQCEVVVKREKIMVLCFCKKEC
uniref:Knottin scorpion toxin-like domain-containing protein n=1 Tax=Hordeum vulgare subsp. vulgare TaxID=112509 RepID=A0A8I7B8Q3_HORVV